MAGERDKGVLSIESLCYVEKHWTTIWKRIHSGGLVQHQIEFAKVLTEFVHQLERGGSDEQGGR